MVIIKYLKITYGSLLICLLYISCASKNKMILAQGGFYDLKVIGSGNANVVVYGRLYSFVTKKPLGTNGGIGIGDTIKARTDTEGKFQFILTPGSYSFTGFGMPYQLLTTPPIKISKGDSVKIDMYLKFVD